LIENEKSIYFFHVQPMQTRGVEPQPPLASKANLHMFRRLWFDAHTAYHSPPNVMKCVKLI